jgi:hypothetical protein
MVLIAEVYELGIVPEFEPFKEKEVVENLHVNSETCTFINKK